MYLIFTHKSPLECKEIQPVHSEGDQAWEFFGRTDVEAETPVLWPPDVKSWLIWKGPDSGKDWGHGERGTTEDEMVGWHHWLDGREAEWTPGVGDGQGGLACCDSWGRKESDTTERLNWTELNVSFNSVTNSSSCPMWGYVVFFQVQCFPDTSWLNFRYSENETVLLLFNTENETAKSICSLLLLSTKQTQSYNSVKPTQHGGITRHNIPNILPWVLLP